MRRLILHIGLEKTGTTAFQAYCAQNRERLGAVYPVDPRVFLHDNHAPLVASYFSPEDAARLRIAGRAVDRVEAVAALKAEAGEVTLVSAEHFSSRFDPGRIAALREDFAGFEATVAIVLRDPLMRALSAYATAVASGRDLTLDAFVEELAGNAYLLTRPTLEAWGAAFGRERLKILRYVEGGDIVADLVRALLPDAPPPAEQVRRNVSPAAAAIARRRWANARLPAFARRLLLWAHAPGGDPPRLSRDQRRRLLAHVEADLAWLAAEYGVAFR